MSWKLAINAGFSLLVPVVLVNLLVGGLCFTFIKLHSLIEHQASMNLFWDFYDALSFVQVLFNMFALLFDTHLEIC